MKTIPTWDELDGMVEGDPLALRDTAHDLAGEVVRLRRVLDEIADYADERHAAATTVTGRPALVAIANTARQAVTR